MGEKVVKPARRRTPRNPEATREVILEAARTIIAEEGLEGLSVSAVAQAARVNRGTAYLHFENREQLVAETIASVSEILLRSVYGIYADQVEAAPEDIDQIALAEGLANFAMSNPDLCRVWLLQVMASPDPSSDPFFRKYIGYLQKFAQTPLAQRGVDTEVLAVLVLAGTFLWPIWTHGSTLDAAARKQAASRFSHELMRLSLYGSMVAERLPEVVSRVSGPFEGGPSGG